MGWHLLAAPTVSKFPSGAGAMDMSDKRWAASLFQLRAFANDMTIMTKSCVAFLGSFGLAFLDKIMRCFS